MNLCASFAVYSYRHAFSEFTGDASVDIVILRFTSDNWNHNSCGP